MSVRMLAVGGIAILVSTLCVAAVPNVENGIDLLLLLCEPYGANSALLWNNVERLGWNVTVVGTNPTVTPCSFLTTPIDVDRTIDEIGDPSAFDVVIVSPTPGTYNTSVDAAAELRGNVQALNLIRRAAQCGATLYAGCSALAVLGDAGTLVGHNVLYHSGLGAAACRAYEASSWQRGGPGTPPLVDGNLVTATNQRYFALEIPEALARSLDGLDRFERSLDRIVASETTLERTPLALSGVVRAASAWGTKGSEAGLDLCALSDGIVVVGFTYAAGEGNADVLVARFDGSGDLVWARTIGGPGRDVGYGVTATEAGIAVCGLTTSAGGGGEDALLFEMDKEGSVLWVRTFGGAGHEAAFDLTETCDHGLVVVGRCETEATQNSALFLFAVEEDGTERWNTVRDGRLYERGLAVVERRAGGFLVAGGTTSTGAGNYDMLLVAYDETGKELWAKTYGAAQVDIAEAVIERADGTIALIGYGDRETRDPNDMELVLAEADGGMIRRRTAGFRRGFDYGQDAVQMPDETVLICGTSNLEGTGHNDAWLIGFDDAGEMLWQQSYGSDADNEWLNGLCLDGKGSAVATGWTRADGQGEHDVLLLSIDPTEGSS